MKLSVLLLAGLLRAASVHTDFEGGSLGQIEKVDENHFRLHVAGQADQNKRNRQGSWYYFRMDDAGSAELTLDMVSLPGEYNFKPNTGAITGDTPPVISYDGRTWTHVKTFEYDAGEPGLRLRIKPASGRFWIAHTPPYTNENLARLHADVAKDPAFHQETIGKSVEGRDLLLWTISSGGSAHKTVWLMFRQHSWESGSSWVGEGAIRGLLSPEARVLRESVTWKILPIA
ncbi:MAG: M14-type cytosolic carboxypeptidase, partial [Bryobacteraceae bacterium]